MPIPMWLVHVSTGIMLVMLLVILVLGAYCWYSGRVYGEDQKKIAEAIRLNFYIMNCLMTVASHLNETSAMPEPQKAVYEQRRALDTLMLKVVLSLNKLGGLTSTGFKGQILGWGVEAALKDSFEKSADFKRAFAALPSEFQGAIISAMFNTPEEAGRG